MSDCPYKEIYIDPHLQRNAFRVEPLSPNEKRCRLKQPEHMQKHDPSGWKWIASGGSALHFKPCHCENPTECKHKALFEFECRHCGCGEFVFGNTDGQGFCCECRAYGPIAKVSKQEPTE